MAAIWKRQVSAESLTALHVDTTVAYLGIEFLEASKHLGDVEKYVKLAKQKSKGPCKIPEKISHAS